MAPFPTVIPRVDLPFLGVNILPANGNLTERELTPSEDGEEGTPENLLNVDGGESELSELSELESDIDSDRLIQPVQKILLENLDDPILNFEHDAIVGPSGLFTDGLLIQMAVSRSIHLWDSQ